MSNRPIIITTNPLTSPRSPTPTSADTSGYFRFKELNKSTDSTTVQSPTPLSTMQAETLTMDPQSFDNTTHEQRFQLTRAIFAKFEQDNKKSSIESNRAGSLTRNKRPNSPGYLERPVSSDYSDQSRPSRSYQKSNYNSVQPRRAESVGHHPAEDNQRFKRVSRTEENTTANRKQEKRISRSESDLTRELNEKNDSESVPTARSLVQQFEARARGGSKSELKPNFNRFISRSKTPPVINLNSSQQNGQLESTESRTGPGSLTTHSGSSYRPSSTSEEVFDNATGPHSYNSDIQSNQQTYTNTDSSGSTNASSVPTENNVEAPRGSFLKWKEEQARIKLEQKKPYQGTTEDYSNNVSERQRSRYSKRLTDRAETQSEDLIASSRDQLLNKHMTNLQSRRQKDLTEQENDSSDHPTWRRNYQVGDSRSGALLQKRRSKEESQLTQASLNETDSYWKKQSDDTNGSEMMNSRMTDSTYSSGSGEEMARSNSEHHLSDMLVDTNSYLTNRLSHGSDDLERPVDRLSDRFSDRDSDQQSRSSDRIGSRFRDRFSDSEPHSLSDRVSDRVSDTESTTSSTHSNRHSRPVSQETQEIVLPTYDSYMKSVVERTSTVSPETTSPKNDSFTNPNPKTHLPPPPYERPPAIPTAEPMDTESDTGHDMDSAHFLDNDVIPIRKKPSPAESVDSMTYSEQDALLHKRFVLFK